MTDDFSDEREQAIIDYENLEKVLEDPKYIFFLDQYREKKFGTNNPDALDKPANTVIEEMVSKIENITEEESIGICIQKQPILCLIDCETMAVWQHDYTVLH